MNATLVIEPKNYPSYTEAVCEMDSDSLGIFVRDGVIGVAQKLVELKPYIEELWRRIDNGEVILGCSTKKEFCQQVLQRTPRAVRYMLEGGNHNNDKRGEIISPPKPKKDTPQVTDAEFADYEREHPHVRQSAANMIDKGMTPTDVVGALVGMEIPAPMAEAAVRIVSGVDATGVHPFEELQIHLSHLRPAFCDTNGEKEFVRVLEKARSTPVTDDRRELAQIDVGMLREIADELLSVADAIEQNSQKAQ